MIAGVDSYGKLTCIKNHQRHMLKTHQSRSDSNEILAIDKRSVWTLLFSFSLHWFFSFFTSFRFCLFRELSKSKHAKSHEFMIFIKFSDKKWAAFFFHFKAFYRCKVFLWNVLGDLKRMFPFCVFSSNLSDSYRSNANCMHIWCVTVAEAFVAVCLICCHANGKADTWLWTAGFRWMSQTDLNILSWFKSHLLG